MARKRPTSVIPTSDNTADTPERQFLNLAIKRLKLAIDADDENRREAVESLNFLEGIDQWDPEELRRRKASHRPALMVNLLPKYVDQVVGDMRQNKVRIKIRPASPTANIHIATIRQGLIGDIEYNSNAEYIYDQAGEMVASCGYGAWRVLHRYTEADPFLQELYLEYIPNPFSVYFSPGCKDAMYSDATYCFILDKPSRDEFKEQWPDKDVPGETFILGAGLESQNWYNDDTVTVAEYYVAQTEKVTMCRLSTGADMEKSAADSIIARWEEQKKENPELIVPTILKTVNVTRRNIRHYTITASEILSDNGVDGEEVPGKFIPVIMVNGKERNISGKRHIRGMIKDAKDPQRMVNYWNTAAAEIVALAPKAPWVGTARQFEGYEKDYAAANVENYPMLKYNIDTTEGGQPIPPPQRTQQTSPPLAILSEIERAERNIQGTVGMSDRDTMAAGPERTGAAVIANKQPSDVGSFAYIDNLHRGILHTGKILNSAIPEIYDTDRDIRVRAWDTTESVVPINTTAARALNKVKQNPTMYTGFKSTDIEGQLQQKGADTRFNDIKEGTYDVISSVGPSFSTQRAEASQVMLALSQTNPKLFDIGGDLIVQNMDFLYADDLASRLRKTLPAGLVPPKEGEVPPPPPPPTPDQVVALKKIEVEDKRIEVQKLRYMREIAMSKGEMKKMILQTLEEVFGNEAPASTGDQVMNGGGA